MLTLKMITEQTERVIAGLEKKHFKNAKETIAQVLELNEKRKSAQNQLDKFIRSQSTFEIDWWIDEGRKEGRG